MDPLADVVEIIETSSLPDWDRELVAAGVQKAYDVWFEKDSKDFIIGVELAGKEPVPYRIDLVKQRKDDGRFVVVDWKTKNAGKLDERWIERETRSPQKNFYAGALSQIHGREIYPLQYEVRGITMEEKPQTKVIPFMVKEFQTKNSLINIRGVEAERDALIDRGVVPFPRYESGCRMFGPQYPCEFEGICWRDQPVPEALPKKRALSHSARQEFIRCPERQRLLEVLRNWDDEKEDNKGDVFHRCMESIYRNLL